MLSEETRQEERLHRALELELAESAREKLATAADYIFGLEPAPHHLLWIEILEAIERGELKRVLFIAPPGHAKSSYVSIVFPTWYIGRHPSHHLLGVGQTDELAKLFGETVRTAIEESAQFRETFPKVLPDYERGWTQHGFFVTRPWAPFDKDPTGAYVGAGGSIVGRRAEGVIIDDPIDEKIARSETELEARKLWIRRSVMSRLKPGGWAIVAGTLWVEGDVVDSLETEGGWLVVRMRAEADSRQVYAEVTIPSGVEWRPQRFEWEEGTFDG